MALATIGISQLSLQYVGIPVRAVTLAGASFNPTADTVQMAFMPAPTQVPLPSDFKTAVWATLSGSLLYPYAAYCLVGPGGTINPGIGTYVIWLKVSDNPEIPVLICGYLEIN